MDYLKSHAYQPGYGWRRAVTRSWCKPLSTVLLTTLLLVGCGGGSPKAGRYGKAVGKQESCCNQLADAAARQSCLDRIVRVDDPAVQESPTNRATYDCVERYFVCDPTSGTATQESSQSQLDCINDLSD